MDRTRAKTVLLAGGWLAQQTPDFRTRLLALGQLRPFAPGDPVFHAGDAAGGIYGVVAGGFAVEMPTAQGGSVTATIIRPPVWFGYGAHTSRRQRILTYRASEAAWALHVPLPALDELARTLPDASRAIGAVAEFAMDVAIQTVSDLLIRPAEGRIAATLLRVTAAGEGALPDDPAGFRLTQAELGEMANASRAVVNRTLGAFERRGWIRSGYQRIAVMDAAALAAFVSGAGEARDDG
jgi:CRP-like cAMP-binding protein